MTSTEFANGVTTTNTHAAGAGRLATSRTTGPGGSVFDDVGYTHDALGRVQSFEDVRAGSTRTYTYDLLGQLSSFDQDGTTTAYAYAGRDMTSHGESELTLQYTDPLRPGLLTGTTAPGASIQAVTTDDNGCHTQLRGRQLAYDDRHRLNQVVNGATTVDVAYDHASDRLAKSVTVGASTTTTLFLGDRTEVTSGTTLIHVVIGLQRIAVRSVGSTRWIHTDETGTGRFFSDEAGARLDGIVIRPFGTVGASPGGPVGPAVFAMNPFDFETGFYFANRRYYCPETGRWLSPDGLYLLQPQTDRGDPRTLALYAYVANDPVNYIDPTGNAIWHVLGGIVCVIVGVVLGALVIAAFATGIGFGILALVGVLVLGGLAYAGAAAVDPTSDFGQFMQGFLIGMNAGLNGVLATALFGPVVGIALGVINFLAVFDDIRTNSIYQGILGWSNWLQPMSWLVLGIGLIFFIVSLIGHLVFLVNGDANLEITGFRFDARTGTIDMDGGLIGNSNPNQTSFNMGNFTFTDRNFGGGAFQHEIGHSLNLAIMGSAVHLAGAIDQNIWPPRGANALAEIMAEDHRGGTPARAGWWR